MKTAIIQFKPERYEKENNLYKIFSYISQTEANVLVFPELSVSGYFYTEKEELSRMSVSVDSDEFNLMKENAFQSGKIIIIGFPENDNGKIYNSIVLFDSFTQQYIIYRKTHLFYKETLVFEKGNTGFINYYSNELDCNFGLMICYDWRFPEAARTLALYGADIIICPSNLVTNLWHKVMPARAIENKVYFLVANRTGIESANEETLKFLGKSAIWDYSGDLLCSASEENEEIIIADIKPSKTRSKSFNSINDIFNDRRPEFYRI